MWHYYLLLAWPHSPLPHLSSGLEEGGLRSQHGILAPGSRESRTDLKLKELCLELLCEGSTQGVCIPQTHRKANKQPAAATHKIS